MITINDLKALAKRCEEEEPSRKLDVEISDALGFAHDGSTPFFTSSIDAALDLVPTGDVSWLTLQWSGESRDWHPEIYLATREFAIDAITVADGIRTPAIALCAAALLARADLLETAA